MGSGLLARLSARKATGQPKPADKASPLARNSGSKINEKRDQPIAKLVPQPQEEVAFGFSTAK